jgi:hypothetical protein
MKYFKFHVYLPECLNTVHICEVAHIASLTDNQEY